MNGCQFDLDEMEDIVQRVRIYQGNVGIGMSGEGAEEALVVGNNLGSFSGDRVVIGDNRAGVQTGLVIGKDANNRGWSLWDVDDNYLNQIESMRGDSEQKQIPPNSTTQMDLNLVGDDTEEALQQAF